MKLDEVLSPGQLDELSIKHAVAAGAAAIALTGSVHKAPAPEHKPLTTHTIQRHVSSDEVRALTAAVLEKYKIDKAEAEKIVALAKKYERPTFPKAKDILAIIGIESSFKANAVSKLKNDPAVGLMQVRPGVWRLHRGDLSKNMDMQIKTGAAVLEKYHARLKNKNDAVHAYNVGIGNFLKGKHNQSYVTKYNAELKNYTDI